MHLNTESGALRIGILGGTFDPIHLGHLIIADQARDQFDLDKILLIPSGHSYFKDNRAQKVLPAEIRYKMTELAAMDNPYFEVSDLEVTRPGNSYTYETIEAIAGALPEASLFFIAGADTVCSLHSWKYPERILKACTVLAAVREGQVQEDELERAALSLTEQFGARIRRLLIPSIDISSTDIRERAAQGKSIHYMVPDPVERYIIETGIYSSDPGIRERSMSEGNSIF